MEVCWRESRGEGYHANTHTQEIQNHFPARNNKKSLILRAIKSVEVLNILLKIVLLVGSVGAGLRQSFDFLFNKNQDILLIKANYLFIFSIQIRKYLYHFHQIKCYIAFLFAALALQ